MFLGKFAGLQAAGKQFLQKLLDKRYIKLYNTHVTKVTPCGPLAQLAEHLTFNQGVPRSSRGWITIFFALFKKNYAQTSKIAGLRHSELVPDGDFYFK